MPQSKDAYLGDDLSIGLANDGYHLAIWAGNKAAPYNEVFFDPDTEAALYEYLKKRLEK